VLALLGMGPLHPYGMQRLIKSWGKDEVVNVGQRANLYKTIRRLHEAGLITVHATERAQQYPERTVYELTEAGRETGLRWLRDMIAVPRNEYPAFPAALSLAMQLPPAELAALLSTRLAALRGRLEQFEAGLRAYEEGLPRIALIETEYQHAVTSAEVNWLAAVIGDLESGRLAWTYEQLAAHAQEDFSRATES
jgi:DNA-binding PadR family transcriptional regulator